MKKWKIKKSNNKNKNIQKKKIINNKMKMKIQ